MWPLIEAFLASIGAGTIAFAILYGIHFWWGNRHGWFDVEPTFEILPGDREGEA
jgi:hypothetical protein